MNKRQVKKALKKNNIQVIHIKPQDVLVCKVKKRLSCDNMNSICEQLKHYFPDNNVLVLDEFSNLSVIKREVKNNGDMERY